MLYNKFGQLVGSLSFAQIKPKDQMISRYERCPAWFWAILSLLTFSGEISTAKWLKTWAWRQSEADMNDMKPCGGGFGDIS
jgi:hypothetical protein